MEQLLHHTIRVLMVLFLIGVAGCVLAIPICAYKFASVMWEKHDEEAAKQDYTDQSDNEPESAAQR